MTSPVAGFSTGISAPAPRPFVLCAAVVSTLAMSALLDSTSANTLARPVALRARSVNGKVHATSDRPGRARTGRTIDGDTRRRPSGRSREPKTGTTAAAAATTAHGQRGLTPPARPRRGAAGPPPADDPLARMLARAVVRARRTTENEVGGLTELVDELSVAIQARKNAQGPLHAEVRGRPARPDHGALQGAQGRRRCARRSSSPTARASTATRSSCARSRCSTAAPTASTSRGRRWASR